MAEHYIHRGPGPLPERWLHCPRKANSLLANKFFAFKAPLDHKFDNQIPPEFRFTPSMLFDSLLKNKIKLGLWIDLTRSERFYNRKEIEDAGCKYVKIECHGHSGAPTEEQTNVFIKLCKMFIRNDPLGVIGVHCTHGYNRTGFMLVSFLVEYMDSDVSVALQEFARIRPPGIYKGDYIKELYRKYDDINDAPPAPPLPNWCYDDNEFQNHGNRKKPAKFKDNPTFMEGVPGVEPIVDRKEITKIRSIVQQLTNCHRLQGFIGSQPVSMDRNNMKYLAEKPYKVSWKADGTRYMMFIADRDEVYFLDRDNSIFKVQKFQFFQRGSSQHLVNTLMDGEMVLDKYQNKLIPRYLVYDIMFINSTNVGAMPFPARLKNIEKEVIEPRIEAMKDGRIRKEKEPFSIRAKPFYEISKAVDLLSDKFAKQLSHEPDGLIFQPSDDPYIYGNSPYVLKWKPLSMNSIDFRLQIKPETRLGYAHPYVGNLLTADNTKFAELGKCTKTLKAMDGKIIECKFENNKWVFMRERTDKSFPNGTGTAEAVLKSIRFPVTECMLLEFIDHHGWKDPMPPPMAPPPKRARTN